MSWSVVATAIHITYSNRTYLPFPSSAGFKKPLLLSQVTEKVKPETVLLLISRPLKNICRAAAAEYKFPDPIPEFADKETEKFRTHMFNRLSTKEHYKGSVEEIVGVCTEIFKTFLHTEYGGPGTLMVVPFIDMAETVNEMGLPGASQAARIAVKWAQVHVDKDWKEWTGTD